MDLGSDISVGEEKILIERIKEGERASFDKLVEMYRNKGLNIAYNLVGNLEDAKDVLQEALIKVYLNIKSFRAESQFFTWFYRILVNCALDLLRRRKTLGKVFTRSLTDDEGKEQDVADERYEPSKVVLNQELMQNLDSCIAELPEKQKACFILKHQQGLNNQEVAHILRCSISTVKVHLFRATKTLQGKLTNYLDK